MILGTKSPGRTLHAASVASALQTKMEKSPRALSHHQVRAASPTPSATQLFIVRKVQIVAQSCAQQPSAVRTPAWDV